MRYRGIFRRWIRIKYRGVFRRWSWIRDRGILRSWGRIRYRGILSMRIGIDVCGGGCIRLEGTVVVIVG